jgi:hypothetical protein
LWWNEEQGSTSPSQTQHKLRSASSRPSHVPRPLTPWYPSHILGPIPRPTPRPGREPQLADRHTLNTPRILYLQVGKIVNHIQTLAIRASCPIDSHTGGLYCTYLHIPAFRQSRGLVQPAIPIHHPSAPSARVIMCSTTDKSVAPEPKPSH